MDIWVISQGEFVLSVLKSSWLNWYDWIIFN